MADMQVRVPSPSSLVQSAFRVVEWELSMAREFLLLPARVMALLEDVESIVRRVQRLLDEVERTVSSIDRIVVTAAETVDGVRTTVSRADRVVVDVERTVSSADSIVTRVGSTVDSADGIVGRVGSTVDSADGIVARIGATVDVADDLVIEAGGLIGRVEPLLDFADSALAPVKPVVEALLVDAELSPETARKVAIRLTEVLVWTDKTIALLEPIADEILESVSSEEIKAVVQFIDHLPALGDSLENDVMPVLASLDTVAPEVHQILEVAQQCLEAVQGIPGFQLLRRRGGDNGNGKGGSSGAGSGRTEPGRPGPDA
ncbi:methyl-accepting chemotaxis protein [Dietzia sp. SLG310A2-38A2]|uniref:methyl-accepting chemotaxis protein n=1 Tax=Dietzia sp. SLG310A2-38A2 TaxID=1630643 RepID=UPI001F507949|nr:methyl-accepting chemotaxis protein [Dietzia sp. SLG310A2-38A2]